MTNDRSVQGFIVFAQSLEMKLAKLLLGSGLKPLGSPPKHEVLALSVVLRTAHLVKESQHVEFGETHVFVGPRYVVSVRHGSLQSHVGLRARCEASQAYSRQGPWLCPLRFDGFRGGPVLPNPRSVGRESG